jgi:hypothetical protein
MRRNGLPPRTTHQKYVRRATNEGLKRVTTCTTFTTCTSELAEYLGRYAIQRVLHSIFRVNFEADRTIFSFSIPQVDPVVHSNGMETPLHVVQQNDPAPLGPQSLSRDPQGPQYVSDSTGFQSQGLSGVFQELIGCTSDLTHSYNKVF